jgi:DNA segregation ATPase FtsK/SpoIIIE-like protein
MSDSHETHELIKEISANQQSLHDDMSSLVDRMASLEQTILDHVKTTPEPTEIDEHQLYLTARALVVESERCSTSLVQRILRIGYSRAARIVDLLEENRIIGPQDGSRPRKILMTPDRLTELEEEEDEAEQMEADGPPITGDDDDLYDDALKVTLEAGKCSTPYLQRKMRIGYNRAAFLTELLERRGVIGPADGTKPRYILIEQ